MTQDRSKHIAFSALDERLTPSRRQVLMAAGAGLAAAALPLGRASSQTRTATENGAKALGIADKVGTLRAGKRADIVLVRATDANMVPLGEVHSALARVATVHNVDTVLIDGMILKWKGKLVGIDVQKVVREAEELSDRLRRRAGGIWAPR